MYDSFGRVITQKKVYAPYTGAINESAAGDSTYYTYVEAGYGTDPAANIQIDERKHVTDAVGPDGSGVSDFYATVTTTNDFYGNKLCKEGYGVDKVTYEYDAMNRVTKETYADNTFKTYAYSITPTETSCLITNQAGTQTKVLYDKLGRYLKTIVNPGTSSQFTTEEVTYNSLGQISKKIVAADENVRYNILYKYNASGELMEEKAEDNSGKLYRQNNYSYGLETVNGAYCVGLTATSKIGNTKNRVIKTFTDGWGQNRKTSATLGGTDISSFNNYDNSGALISTVDPKGNTTTYGYNYNMQVVSEKNAKGKTKTTQYNAIGQKTSETDFMNNTIYYSYDNMGHLDVVSKPMADSEYMCTYTYYDQNGDKSREEVYTYYDPITYVNESRDARYSYDNRHRLLYVTQDNSSYTKYFYDTVGNVSKMATGMTDADLNLESGFSDGVAFTNYTYHPYLNKVMTVTDPDGTVHNSNYNYFGLLTNQSYTKNNSTYGEIDYTYDGFGQLVSKTADNKTEAFKYDLLGNVLEATGETGITKYNYDDMGRLLKEYVNNSILKKFTYDNNSNRTSFKMYTDFTNLQQDLSYVYDSTNLLTTINEGTNAIASYTYNDNGNMLTENNNVVNSSFTYNLGGLVTNKTTSNSTGTALQTDAYTYNLDGNVSIENGKSYTYDLNNRLQTVTQTNGTLEYTFDIRSNRYQEKNNGTIEKTYTYDTSNNNRLVNLTVGDNKTDYSYDNRGNLYLKTTKTYTATGTAGTEVTSMGESTLYEYDGFNRLTDVTNGGNKADYEYNTAGIRTSKTVNGERIDFVLDGIDVIAEIKDGDVTNYVRGLTGIIYRKAKDGTKTYYVKNNHGDVTKLVNSSGVVIKSYNYNEFGIESNVDKTDTNPFRYCGEYYDNETGLIYLRARYYDMTIGRFISEDPARDELNWYAYCGGDPINSIDPTGLDSWVFYDPRAFSEQADSEAERLQSIYGTSVHKVDIWTLKGFLLNWNKMKNDDGSIDGVSMLFHGSPYTIYIGEDEFGNPEQLTSSTQNVTPKGSTGYYVGNLAPAKMDSLNLMSCNGGHLDLIYANKAMQKKGFNHNIAVELLVTQKSRIVYGMDGSLSYTKIGNSYIPRLAWDQDDYYSWTPSRKYLGKRSPYGQIAYWIDDDGGVGYCIMSQ